VKEIDDFLEFLMDFIYDDRLSIYKRMKYGYRHYHIDFEIDEEKSTSYPDKLRFIIDNRNVCIEIISPGENDILIIEDKELVEKWSAFCEEFLNKNMSEKVHNIFEKSLQSCFRKDIFREYQMRKLGFSGDDPLVSE
jgi:hypothetical protein